MTANVSQNSTVTDPGALSSRAVAGIRLATARLSAHRAALIGYAQVLSGTAGRMALQLIYFFVLANTLSLSEMGVFASVSSAGLMIGCLAGFGFQSFVFRSAAHRRHAMGGYLAAYYVSFVLATPIMALLAGGVYAAIFRDVIALPGFLAIMAVEVIFWRFIEIVVQMNNGLGRYASAAAVIILSVAFRSAAALLFWWNGGGDAELWGAYYLVGNAAAAIVLGLAFHPPVKLRFRTSLLRGRLRESLLYAMSSCIFYVQSEIDKVIVLMLAGERVAGIYAIAMRIIDLTAVPLRPVFVMYSRRLIQAGAATRALVRECLKVEASVALVSTAGIFAIVALLALWPNLLGRNVAAAWGMLAALFLVPAVKNLQEFHAELFFAFRHMGVRAVLAVALTVLKAAGLAALLILTPQIESWSLWLNALYAAIYAISFLTIYRLLTRSAHA